MGHTDEDRQEKFWLVKSSTRILGPFAADEVGELLLKKHISIIDEVRQPHGRWKYVREHKIFDEVVRRLREEQENSPDHTQTQTQTQTLTANATVSSPSVLLKNDELTPTPIPIVKSDASSSIGVKEITSAKETDLGVASLGRPNERAYGVQGPRKPQLSAFQKNTRMALMIVAGLFIFGIGVVQFRKNQKMESGYESLIQEALRFKALQLYEKSLVSYKKAAQLHEPENSVKQQMALVLIVLDRQNVLGRRLLEQELSDQKGSRSRTIDAHLGIAISQVLEGNLKDGEETLQKVLILEPANLNARLDLALIELRKGNWLEADRQLQELSHRYSPHPLLLLARGVALLELGTKDPQRVRQWLDDVSILHVKTSQLRRELLLLSLSLLPASDPNWNSAMEEFLSKVGPAGGRHARDLHLDWNAIGWDSLDKYCRELVARASPQPRLKAMRAICMNQDSQEIESRRFVQEALVQAPKDPLILLTQANLLYRAGMRNEAVAVLRVPELASSPLRDTLHGQICLDQGDLGCAEKNFKDALSAPGPRSLVAISGLASVQASQDHVPEAKALIREGLEREPGYLPLIELKDKIENKL